MLARILSLLKDPSPLTVDTVGAPFERRQLDTIARIVRERFGIDASTAERLIETARTQLDASLEDWIFASAVREGFSAEERVAIVSLLWEVVYVDGRLAHLEETLMRRLSEELGIGETEGEIARAQAFARVGSRRGAGTDSMEAE